MVLAELKEQSSLEVLYKLVILMFSTSTFLSNSAKYVGSF